MPIEIINQDRTQALLMPRFAASARRFGAPFSSASEGAPSMENHSPFSRHIGCITARPESENHDAEARQEVERDQANHPRPRRRGPDRCPGRLDPAADHVELPAAVAVVVELPEDDVTARRGGVRGPTPRGYASRSLSLAATALALASAASEESAVASTTPRRRRGRPTGLPKNRTSTSGVA